MKVTVVWKDHDRADTTWYCVEKTTFIPENGPYQFLKVVFEEENTEDIKIICINANDIERIYYRKTPTISI